MAVLGVPSAAPTGLPLASTIVALLFVRFARALVEECLNSVGPIELAQRAIRQADLNGAYEILANYVRTCPDDEEGWLWLSRVISDRRLKKEYLEYVLHLNPENHEAQQELQAVIRELSPQPPFEQPMASAPVTAATGPQRSTFRTAPPEFLVAPEQMASRPVRNRPGLKLPNWTVRRHRLAWGIGSVVFVVALLLLVTVAVSVLPLFLGQRTYVILSGSMEPTIHTGSVVFAHVESAKDLEVGDVIAYNPNPEAAIPIVHRIIKIEERQGTRYFTTQGDANDSADGEVALPPQALVVTNSLPVAGYIVYYAASPVGTLALVVVPLILLIILWLKDRVLALRKPKLA
jgi:signal peptidase I